MTEVERAPNKIGDWWADPQGNEWMVYGITNEDRVLHVQRRAPGISCLCHLLAWQQPHCAGWRRVELAP